MEIVQFLVIPATVIGSVLLVISCLFFKGLRRKKGNTSSSPPKQTKSGKANKHDENRQSDGITNLAFTDGNEKINSDVENDSMVYDYAKNEHGPGTEWKISDQDCNVSPLYADANDTTTRFYFSLERDATKSAETQINTEDDEGSYVIAIPENIYDKPEDSMELDTATDEEEGAMDASQLYFTLEECSEDDKNNESNSINVAPEENADYTDGIYEMTDETWENGRPVEVAIDIEGHDTMNNDQPYIINVANEVPSGNKWDGATTVAGDGEEELCVINVPNDMNDEPSEQMGIERDEDDGCLEIQVDKHDECSGNNGVEGDFENSENIYENVTVCLQSKNEGHDHVNNAKISDENTAATTDEQNMVTIQTFSNENSRENMGYFDDEVLPQSKPEGTIQNDNNGDLYVAPIETLASGCLSEDNNSKYNEYYDDGDIYEDWEDHIIGRMENMGSNQISGCGDFYQNVRDLRPSLVMQKSG